jgi:pyruvate dehydrogenase E2 component (dihydrolipoamide acetyltransferase)
MTNENRYEVVMPKLGLIMTEAQLTEWHKQDGEWIAKGEPLFSLESDKSEIEIESPANGRLQILIPAGETVPVMTPVAYLLRENAAATAPTAAAPKPQSQSIVRATPKARIAARKLGIDLAALSGSGPRGMIVTADLPNTDLPQLAPQSTVQATPVAKKMAAELGLDLQTIKGTGENGRITRDDVTRTAAALIARPAATQPTPSLPLTGLRGVIAERLSAGWRERPQVTLTTEIDATNLVSARQQLMAEMGQKVSYNAFFMAAAARALHEQPHVNACLTEAGLVHLPDINVGIAVDTERGLLVPVVRNAAAKSITELSTEIDELAQRALSGQSLPDELTGGTFTITNLGAFGIDAFTPIINPPETAVLGIGRIVKRPFAVGQQVEVRDTVVLSLSFDHRLLDGGPAAHFLQRIGQLVERPFALTAR